MPAAPATKQRVTLRNLVNLSALSNKADLIGKSVRLIGTKYRGQVGKIIGAFTALDKNAPSTYEDCRGTYYTVETPTVVLFGLTWEEAMRV